MKLTSCDCKVMRLKVHSICCVVFLLNNLNLIMMKHCKTHVKNLQNNWPLKTLSQTNNVNKDQKKKKAIIPFCIKENKKNILTKCNE